MVTCLPSEASHVQFYLDKYPNIQWVHSLFAGVDKFLAIEKIKKKDNILLTNARGAYSDSLAEYSIGAMLYFSYDFPKYITSFDKREWIQPKHEMINCKTITIVGYGKNGIAIAKRVKLAFNMKVIGVVRKMRNIIEGKEYCDELSDFENIDNAISKCDFLLTTLPQTKESNGLYNYDKFKKMKSNCLFINIGRGSAVIEKDLVQALNEGIIRAAVLDVNEKEPLDRESPLYELGKEKLLLTCHSGDITTSYVDQCFAVLENNLKTYLKTKNPETIVNKELGY